MKCPGQDMRFWGPDDVFELSCQACGEPVEFFRDDAFRRCPKCGGRIENPNVTLGCAQWCAYAKECLGYDPKTVDATGSEDQSLMDKLIEAVKDEFHADPQRFSDALLMLDRAEYLLRHEGGDPRVVRAAALLYKLDNRADEQSPNTPPAEDTTSEGPSIATRIMRVLAVDRATIEHVRHIIVPPSDDRSDTLEARIVRDAARLVTVLDEVPQSRPPSADTPLSEAFETDSGRAKASQAASDSSGPDGRDDADAQDGPG